MRKSYLVKFDIDKDIYMCEAIVHVELGEGLEDAIKKLKCKLNEASIAITDIGEM